MLLGVFFLQILIFYLYACCFVYFVLMVVFSGSFYFVFIILFCTFTDILFRLAKFFSITMLEILLLPLFLLFLNLVLLFLSFIVLQISWMFCAWTALDLALSLTKVSSFSTLWLKFSFLSFISWILLVSPAFEVPVWIPKFFISNYHSFLLILFLLYAFELFYLLCFNPCLPFIDFFNDLFTSSRTSIILRKASLRPCLKF